jgi:alpha-D-xyloside xylohydrolase
MNRVMHRRVLGGGGGGTVAAVMSLLGYSAGPLEKRPDGILLSVNGGFLRVQIKADAIVRVMFAKVREPRVDTLAVIGPDVGTRLTAMNPFASAQGTVPASVRPPKWTLTTTSTTAILATAKLNVNILLADGTVTFTDRNGRPILGESPGARRMTPTTVQGEQTYHVQQQWQANADESLYGLGQRQEGKLDIKGYDLDLWQRNTVVEIPFLVSSRGYGIFWDNTSFTKFGDIRPFEPIPAAILVDLRGQPGGLSAGTFVSGTTQLQNPATTASILLGGEASPTSGAASPPPSPPDGGRGRGAASPGVPGWQGEILAPVTGDYQFQTYSNLDVKVWLDGQLRIDHWKQNWATENDQFKVTLTAGRRYPIKVTSSPGATLRLLWKTPAPAPDTSLWSEVGEAIDYYFVYGPELDDVIAGYRTLTGQATLLPRWAYGFWQSKNKYNTQAEVLNTVAEFRRRGIPLDTIVQDWQYWKADAWGTHEFEASRYPDPDAMIKAIHASHARFMISVWGKFYPQVENAKALEAIGGLYLPALRDGTRDWLQQKYAFYDAFNAPARRLFWSQVDRALFRKGVDAWWMDATEPDLVQPSPPTLESLRSAIDRTAIGTASRVMNAYALVNSEAVYDGQRSAAPNQRVFILTRSGFAGIQRYATVTWSGDITSEWTTLRKQITAGLGFSIAGTPYWTSDTGGYTMQNRFARAGDGDALDEWRELNARWFQFSTFCPILRVHGTDRPREMWNLGDETTAVYQSELTFDRLRYALFPYIYSAAARVTHEGYTLMMDFRADPEVRAITDQYMFGPAFLVNPVTEYKSRSRRAYLPAGTGWYDFWTGKHSPGGQTIAADAPYDRIPLFMRAGSIVPIGPEQQYIGEKDARSLTIYVYAGANGQFTLYEDDGLTYDYERRQFSRIPMVWNDATRTLTLARRAGSFTGMPGDRAFHVVLVSPERPAGYSNSPSGTVVAYRGDAVRVKL